MSQACLLAISLGFLLGAYEPGAAESEIVLHVCEWGAVR